ncbi:hypothetical protein GCM10022289_39690 [Pedobacter jeongneungensis]|uniref:SprT-like family protein n=1 Tax=Pedobacter jeongneungensis TaxID=947309 RepID=A0ABP8BP18_9SPHI
MKTINYEKNKKLHDAKRISLILAALILLVTSCKKNNNKQGDQDINFNVLELKSWFADQTAALTDEGMLKGFNPLWDQAKMSETNKEYIYEVNLENTRNIFTTGKLIDLKDAELYNKLSIFKLVIIKDKVAGSIRSAYMNILSEDKNQILSDVHYQKTGNFSGVIQYYNLNSSYNTGWHYTNGKIDTHYSEVQYDKDKPTTEGICGSQPVYQTICPGPGESTFSCYSQQIGGGYYQCDKTLQPDNGDGGGFSGDGGFGVGRKPLPVDAARKNKDIIDSLRGYPCAQALLAKLPDLNTNIAKLIKKTFGIDPIDLKFRVDNTLKNTAIDGRYDQFSGSAPNSGATYTISLNPDVLSKSSQEYILVTMYHEALHAYVAYAKATLSADVFAATFGSLEFNGGRTLFKEINGHYELAANNYLNGLSEAIKTFNTNYNSDRASALAHGGIVELSPSDRLINDQERDTTKPGYTGTKCP